MTKRIDAKHKIDRRLGVNLWGRPKSPVNARSYGPGQHGQRHGKPTDYGTQLLEKQKLKGYYGNIGERQFATIYKKAMRMKGDSAQNLIGLLESRLDAIIYRMRVVPTVFAARQFVSHGHIKVNGQCVDIPSYKVSVGDVIEVKESSREIPMVLTSLQSSERETPEYIRTETQHKATYLRVPELSDVPYPVQMQPNLIIEFYSR